jgi:hypothetical protein
VSVTLISYFCMHSRYIILQQYHHLFFTCSAKAPGRSKSTIVCAGDRARDSDSSTAPTIARPTADPAAARIFREKKNSPALTERAKMRLLVAAATCVACIQESATFVPSSLLTPLHRHREGARIGAGCGGACMCVCVFVCV